MDYFWRTVIDLCFQAEYVKLYRERFQKLLTASRIGVAVVCSGAFAGLAFWDQVPWLFALIAAVCSLWQIASEHIPLIQSAPCIRCFEKEAFQLSREVKDAWAENRSADELTMRRVADEFQKRFLDLEDEFLGRGLSLPGNRKLEEEAFNEVEKVLKDEFN